MLQFIFFAVFVAIIVVIANYVRKVQQGGFSQYEIAKLKRRMMIAVPVILILFMIASSIVVVPVGERMVVYNLLSKRFSKPLTPGYGLVLPLMYEKHIYDIRSQIYTMSGVPQEGDVMRSDSIEVKSLDGLGMDLDITVRFHVDENEVNDLHSEIGRSYVDKIVRPTVREIIRLEFAQHEATEAISTKRDIIKKNLQDRMTEALGQSHLVLEEVQLRNIILPAKLVAAIEEKKAAQQEAERMQYILAKERQEKERIQIEAEAQAERIRIVNEALSTNPHYLHWLAIDKLNDNIQLVISDGKTILNLDAIKSD